ncbi:MAG: serine--tRNA ligase [Thermoproteota archaeon]
MIDIKIVRERPEIIRADLEKRGDAGKVRLLEELIKLDLETRQLQVQVENLRHRRNVVSEEIARLAKAGKDVEEIRREAEALPSRIKELDAMLLKNQSRIREILMRLPNILHESVPFGRDDSENVEVRRWGKPKELGFTLKPHGELIEAIGVGDFVRAAKVSGAGFVYLLGDLALLDLALVRFAIDSLISKGFILVEPPLMLRREAYEGVVDLEDFETMMYKVSDTDLYMIATSEHPLVAMYMDEIIDEDDLPIKFVGLSTNFRKEIGSKGVDTKGLFRMHQFNKVEQVIFCKPEDSWKMHEELIGNAEELFQALEIPYRVVNCCTGDIGTVAAKKYDLEAWSPRQKKYVEVVSCSNCTDYQARRLNIRCGKVGGEKRMVHTLNSTAIATSRALVAILENYQLPDGSVEIPKVLIPYMGGLERIKSPEKRR